MDFNHARDLRKRSGRQFYNRWLRVGGARRRLLTFLVLLAGAIALLPYVIVKTSLRNIALSAAMPSDAIRATARDASFSWVGGSSLTGVEVKDAGGNVLLAAEKIGIDRAPGSLLMSPRELGVLEIIKPTLHIKVRPDGSNVDRKSVV